MGLLMDLVSSDINVLGLNEWYLLYIVRFFPYLEMFFLDTQYFNI